MSVKDLLGEPFPSWAPVLVRQRPGCAKPESASWRPLGCFWPIDTLSLDFRWFFYLSSLTISRKWRDIYKTVWSFAFSGKLRGSADPGLTLPQGSGLLQGPGQQALSHGWLFPARQCPGRLPSAGQPSLGKGNRSRTHGSIGRRKSNRRTARSFLTFQLVIPPLPAGRIQVPPGPWGILSL